MNTELAPETHEFYQVVRAWIAAKGGVDILRRCDADPALRAPLGDILAEIGVWDLDPRGSAPELEAAAAACRAAGSFALPYPVAERLAAGGHDNFGALAVIGGPTPRVNMADLPLRWAVSDGEGNVATVTSVQPPLRTKLGAFTSDVEIGPWRRGGDAELALTLQMWTLLGLAERAAADTNLYVQDRHQFGQPLSHFQAVQFRLTEVEVALQAFAELAKYTLWSVGEQRLGAWTDVVALRLAGLETADVTFRVGHQLHGAIGFCDETDLSWLSRASQPLRRLPWGYSQTEARLLELIDEYGFDGLFGVTSLDRVDR